MIEIFNNQLINLSVGIQHASDNVIIAAEFKEKKLG